MKYLRNTFALLLFLFGISLADEGMWTFDNPPRKLLKDKYGFDITQEWLDHVRMSSVRFNDGGSGSFVSPTGLVMTNHHVGLGQIQKLSTKENDFVKDGFYARSLAEELKCADLELNVLVEMENITDKVFAASTPNMQPDEAIQARNAKIAELTKESREKTGLRSDLVSLYNGSEFWIYRYKKFTDVRLVMAPEEQIAFFGGDPDNFTFPRYDLDMCFFRVYENDKPYNPPHYLKWKTAGAQDGELVFTSGHPGTTNRLWTMAQLEYQRDFAFPAILKSLHRRMGVLHEYGKRGDEEKRRALVLLRGLENSQKAQQGQYEGLLDNKAMAIKLQEETELRNKINANPDWKKNYAHAWDSISSAINRNKQMFRQLQYRGVVGQIATRALTIARYGYEMKKPNAERIAQFQDSNLDALKFNLFSPAPIYKDFEEIQLADRFAEALEMLGDKDPWVIAVLNGKSPQEAAKEIVQGTQLDLPEFRKALIEGGANAIEISTDPMIVMARKIAPIGDEMTAWQRKNITNVTTPAIEAIGKARFAVYGKDVSPDANFTLRLSYGQVKGFPMNGTKSPSMTTMYGLYDRALSFQNQKDFEIPQRFKDGINKLNLATPMNFASTNDVVGGNSGSPVINANAEIVGLIFDGNIQSLPGRFYYSEEVNRSVSVHPGVMIETMRKLYDAGKLADEIEGIVTKPEPPKETPVKQTKPAPKKKK